MEQSQGILVVLVVTKQVLLLPYDNFLVYTRSNPNKYLAKSLTTG